MLFRSQRHAIRSKEPSTKRTPMTNSTYTPPTYTPPKVWTWDAENGGRFSKINRPIAGATHDKALPVGEHSLQLHSLGTPNGVKVTIMLEELLALGKDAEYDAFLINITEGSQFSSGLSRSTLILKSPRCSTPKPVSAYSSRALFCSILPKSLTPLCPKT